MAFKVKISINSLIILKICEVLSGYNPGAKTTYGDPVKKKRLHSANCSETRQNTGSLNRSGKP